MAVFALDALSARKGDALVLRWGTAASTHLALIDGGPSTVYDKAVLPHLQELAGTDPAGRPLPVALRLVVVSHVDDDHIQGILDLTTAIDIAQKTGSAVPATILEAWHNAFADMEFLADFADQPELQEAIREVAAQPAALLDASGTTPGGEATPSRQLLARAESVTQGRELDRALNRMASVRRNSAFADRSHFVRDGAGVTVDGLEVTVLAPNTKLLSALREHWKKERKKALARQVAKARAGVAALAAAFDDPSILNQSSIVLLLKFKGKSMLLTGDARGDHIIDAIKASPGLGTPLHVDVLKVPHHGSAHSNGPKLFQAVTADHYVISGNGEHGNPHADALRALFETQRGREITVHLTNRPAAGAVKPADVAKARDAQAVLDAAEADPNVTLRYRKDGDPAISVELL
jgi:beta-lactamase superfamily II metal-dependent hydrolase